MEPQTAFEVFRWALGFSVVIYCFSILIVGLKSICIIDDVKRYIKTKIKL
jgi:hypothetical protein